jgi:hypothetical protein
LAFAFRCLCVNHFPCLGQYPRRKISYTKNRHFKLQFKYLIDLSRICVCVCVRARARIRFGEYGRIWITRITFRKTSICLIFWCPNTKTFLSVKNYSKMYSKMSPTLKSIVEKMTLGYYRLLLLSMFELFPIITPVHPTTRGQPRKRCSDSAGHFLR